MCVRLCIKKLIQNIWTEFGETRMHEFTTYLIFYCKTNPHFILRSDSKTDSRTLNCPHYIFKILN